jgi:hypothetical protein
MTSRDSSSGEGTKVPATEDRESFIGDDEDGFVADMVSFGVEYAATVRDDHRHFVEAFREGRIPGVTAT